MAVGHHRRRLLQRALPSWHRRANGVAGGPLTEREQEALQHEPGLRVITCGFAAPAAEHPSAGPFLRRAAEGSRSNPCRVICAPPSRPQDASNWLEIQPMPSAARAGVGRSGLAAWAGRQDPSGKGRRGARDHASERCRPKAASRQGSSYGAAHRQQPQQREDVRHTEVGQSQEHGRSPCHSVPLSHERPTGRHRAQHRPHRPHPHRLPPAWMRFSAGAPPAALRPVQGCADQLDLRAYRPQGGRRALHAPAPRSAAYPPWWYPAGDYAVGPLF